jgi:hypothetical protein
MRCTAVALGYYLRYGVFDKLSSALPNRVSAAAMLSGLNHTAAARLATKRLLRHAFEFADLRFDKGADPFASVIRCTCGGAADSKMISKWARALRYAAIRKPPEMRLKPFMKQAGGVNECAAGDADKRRRHRRPLC